MKTHMPSSQSDGLGLKKGTPIIIRSRSSLALAEGEGSVPSLWHGR